MFGDLLRVPKDPTTIGACFAAQIEELITIDRSISLLLRALFFYIARGCVAKAKVLFKRNSSSIVFVVLFRKKRKIGRKVKVNSKRKTKKFVHVVSPPLRCSHASKISGTCCVFCAKIFRFLFLCIKLKLFSKEYSLIHAHAPYHKKETNIG